MKKKLHCASFFAGVGGIDLGFEEAGFQTIYANEFDRCAADTYEANFKIKVDCRDINVVPATEIPDFDIMLAGFPCQAFSVAGYREGFNDKKGRGSLFFELVRIIKAKQPRILFFENVKNLKGHDHGNTYKVIKEALNAEGYDVQEKVLNSSEYGNIPQNRERIYIICFKKTDTSAITKFQFPEPIPLKTSLRNYIDYSNKQEDYYYYGENFDYYEELVSVMTRKDTVYQWRRKYVRENKSGLCPTLTANMGTGGHNVPLIITDDSRFRKLTPRECFNLQGFPKDFVLPTSFARSQLYKQAGNSVTVPVIKRIAMNIKEAIK